MIDIQAMRELHSKATPGEWKSTIDNHLDYFGHRANVTSKHKFIGLLSDADAAFIAEAHNKWNELLDLAELGLKEREWQENKDRQLENFSDRLFDQLRQEQRRDGAV